MGLEPEVRRKSRVMMSIGSEGSIASDSVSFVRSPPLSADAVPVPPDGGWGWVIVLASFTCNLILDGIAYTFGVLLNPLVKDFDSDSATVSWVGSLLCGTYMLSGPLVGGLVNRFGCRPVCMVGAVVAWAAISLSTLSPSVPVLMLTYGVLGGFGLGLIYLPAIICVGFYFESRRALATGISVCGSGVGTFLFAPIANHLISVSTWQTSNLIFGAVCLLCILCGATMRPLQLEVDSQAVAEDERKDLVMTLPDGTKVPSGGSKAPTYKSVPAIRSVLTMPKIAEEEEPLREPQEEEEQEEEEEEEPLKIGGGLTGGKQVSEGGPGSRPRRRNESENYPPTAARFGTMRPNFSTPHLRPVPHRRESVDSAIIRSDQELRGSEAKLPRPMSRADIFYTGSIRNLVEEETVEDGLKPNRQSFISLRRRSSIVMPRNSLIGVVKEEDEMKEEKDEPGIMAVLSSMTNLELLGDPKFLLICASNTFGFLGFYVPFVYLPSLAEDQLDISSDQGALLLSVVGISNTLGRIVSGWLSDFAFVDSLFVVNCSLVLSSLCVFFFPFVTSYTMLLTVGAFFGLSIAAYISLTSIVLVDLLGLEKLTSAFGLLTMFRGAASIVGPPIAGAVFEATASLNISFYLAGSFLLAAAVTSMLADLVRRRTSN
jgi:MFS family permease